MGLRVAGYVRVSTAHQVQYGTSAKEQENKFISTCEKEGHTLVEVYKDEGISGKTIAQREGLKQLIRDARRKKFDMVMFSKLDRAARNFSDIWRLIDLFDDELGIDIFFTDQQILNGDKHHRKMITAIYAIFADMERSFIRERTAGGQLIRWKDLKNECGSLPYGYILNKDARVVEVNEDQAKIYKKIVSLYIDSHYSYRDIALYLDEKGIPTPSASRNSKRASKHWNTTTIGDILKNEAYKGLIISNKNKRKPSKTGKKCKVPDIDNPKPEIEWVKIPCPPLIEEDRWNLIQNRISVQKRKPKHENPKYSHLFLTKKALGRAFICGECDSAMSHNYKDRKNGKYDAYYVCTWKGCGSKERNVSMKKPCILKMVNAEKMDDKIWEAICQVMSNPCRSGEDWYNNSDVEYLRDEINYQKIQLKALKKEIKNLTKSLGGDDSAELRKLIKNQISDCIEQKNITKSKINLKEDELRGYDESLKAIQDLQNFISQSETNAQPLSEYHKKVPANAYEKAFKQFLHNLPFEEKKRIIEAVVAPELGGKIKIRFQRHQDWHDPSEQSYASLPKDPLLAMEPIADLQFSVDLKKIGRLITGFDRTELLKNSDLTAGKEGKHDELIIPEPEFLNQFGQCEFSPIKWTPG